MGHQSEENQSLSNVRVFCDCIDPICDCSPTQKTGEGVWLKNVEYCSNPTDSNSSWTTAL